MICYKCGTENPLSQSLPTRSELCVKCSSYLRCCMNCRFYDPAAPKACREPMAELVRDKEAGNYCDYFSPGDKKSPSGARAEEARKKLEALFRKKSS